MDVSDASRGKKAGTARKRPKLLRHEALGRGPGGITVPLVLTKAGKQALRSKGKLKLTAAVSFTPDGGDPNTKLAVLHFKWLGGAARAPGLPAERPPHR